MQSTEATRNTGRESVQDLDLGRRSKAVVSSVAALLQLCREATRSTVQDLELGRSSKAVVSSKAVSTHTHTHTGTASLSAR